MLFKDWLSFWQQPSSGHYPYPAESRPNQNKIFFTPI